MTITAAEPLTIPDARASEVADAPDRLWRRVLASRRIVISGGVLLLTLLACLATLPWTYFDSIPTRIYYDRQDPAVSRRPPSLSQGWLLFGTDLQGRSLLGRTLLGGTISLSVGAAAAAISVVLGVTVGLVAGYRGGWVDDALTMTPAGIAGEAIVE